MLSNGSDIWALLTRKSMLANILASSVGRSYLVSRQAIRQGERIINKTALGFPKRPISVPFLLSIYLCNIYSFKTSVPDAVVVATREKKQIRKSKLWCHHTLFQRKLEREKTFHITGWVVVSKK